MKSNLKFICVLTLSLIAFTLNAQNKADNPVVIEIGTEKIYLSELLEQFNIGSVDDIQKLTRDERNEYLNLYLIFKLKLKESYALGLDTTKNFLTEYKEYRNQAVSRYLYDREIYDNMFKELYHRYLHIAKASHILVSVDEFALPKDTLAAYKRAMDIRNRAIKGEDFSGLAVELSDDSTARDYFDLYAGTQIAGNKGDLGFLSVFTTPAPFEDFIFTAKDGGISMPVRTGNGYHIIHLDRRIAFYGKVTLDHIWIPENEDANQAKEEIEAAYNSLLSGMEFGEVAKKYSKDENVQITGGRVANIVVNNMIPEYTIALSELELEEFSKPFYTSVGWHIVRPIQKTETPPIEEVASLLDFRIERLGRKKPAVDKFVQEQKRARNFTEVKVKELNIALEEVEKVLTDSVFYGSWTITEKAALMKNPLFSIHNKWYTQQDLLNYIGKNQKGDRFNAPYALSMHVRNRYQQMISEIILDLADNLFEQEIPSLGKTTKAFYEGLLVYAFNEREIWNKAFLDTVGLRKFYESTKNEHYSLEDIESNPYMWGKRAQLTVWTLKGKDCFNQKKCNKIFQQSLTKNYDEKTVFANLSKSLDKRCKTQNTEDIIKFKEELEELDELEDTAWKKGTYSIEEDKVGYIVTVVKDIKSPELKQLSELKGNYINNYQVFLEEYVNNMLLKKYPHKIHFEIFQ